MVLNRVYKELATQHVLSEQTVSVVVNKEESWMQWINRKINALCVFIFVKFSSVLAFCFAGYSKKLQQLREQSGGVRQLRSSSTNFQSPNPLVKQGQLPKDSVLLKADEFYQLAEQKMKDKAKLEAKELYKQAAKLDHLGAIFKVGEICLEQAQEILAKYPLYQPIPMNEELSTLLNEAMAFYRRAAERGHAAAMFKLGGLLIRLAEYHQCDAAKHFGHFDQILSEKYYRDGEAWLTKAAQRGNHVDSIVSLGQIYYAQGKKHALNDDFTKAETAFECAFQWFKKVEKTGNQEALNQIAFMLQEGLGVSKDEDAAFRIYSKLEKTGNRGDVSSLLKCAQLYTRLADLDEVKRQNYLLQAKDWLAKYESTQFVKE